MPPKIGCLLFIPAPLLKAFEQPSAKGEKNPFSRKWLGDNFER
jgi:hypothetical protein